jgi:hypothetical protein
MEIFTHKISLDFHAKRDIIGEGSPLWYRLKKEAELF